MFALNSRFQILSVVILLILVIDYLCHPRLKTLSNRCFSILLCVSVANLGFDITTVFTITHPEIVSDEVNRLCHQFFIGSVLLSLYLNFLYVVMVSREQKRFRWGVLLPSLLPLLVSLFFIMFGSLQYHRGEDGFYSYGPMAYTVYICGVIYLILEFLLSFQKDSVLNQEQKVSIRLGLMIWFVALLIQIIVPQLLLSGAGITLLLLCIYLAFENQRANLGSEVEGFNQNAFRKMLCEVYERNSSLYMMSVICDNRSRINSLFGYEAGIDTLNLIHKMMTSFYSSEVYRARENTFVIFSQQNPQEQQVRLDRLVYALNQCNINGLQIKYHIGVIDVRKYTSSRDDIYSLMSFMNRMKERDNAVYTMNDEMFNQWVRFNRIEQILTKAIAKDGFDVVYQPIFWPGSGQFQSMEALVRLRDGEELGFISPEEFIPIAEQRGMIVEIGNQVLEKVAAFVRKYYLQQTTLQYIEVNLSPIQAVLPDIDIRLCEILKRYGVAPEFINLEITETAMMDNGERGQRNIEKLKQCKFTFSLDDFGTGYSNLSQILQFSYQLIKLDKSLIWPAFGFSLPNSPVISAVEQEKAMELLENVIHMMKQMRLGIVAEGVETKEMAEYLADAGVDHLQGYYYSRPVSEEKCMECIEAQA